MTDTKFDYDDLLIIKEQRQKEISESFSLIKNLVDDVDAPMRKSVAMLNLLGVETIWSCCGFDYEGQPKHKTHEYGNIYIRTVATPETFDIALKVIGYSSLPKNMQMERNPWTAQLYNVGGRAELQFKVYGKVDWQNQNSWLYPGNPHFHEGMALAIAVFESALLELKDNFKDEVIIIDNNFTAIKNGVSEWAYPPKAPWIVKKTDYI